METSDGIITLKDIILLIQSFIKYLFKKWFVIAILAILFSGFFIYKHFTSEIKYKSELRFVVEGQNGTGGGLGGLLGSIGIRKSGGVSPFKILEVGKSSNILLKVLSAKTSSGEFIGNRIINTYNLTKKWSENNASLKDFQFTQELNDRELSDKERIVIRKLMRKFWSKDEDVALCKFTLDEAKGIYVLNSSTINEDLSFEISTQLFKFIKLFFEDEIFENQKQFSEILTHKADSLRVLRDQKVRQLARFNARNRGLVNDEVSADYTILTQEQLVLNSALAEVIKNKEMADVNLKDIQPLFLEIDRPFKPLPVITSSLIRNAIIGGVIGIMLGSILLIFIKIYQDAMSS